MQLISYPTSRQDSQVDDYHGTPVRDPYRWLEDLDSPETRAWVEAQNKLTFGFLESLPMRTRLKARLMELWNYPKFGLPQKEAGSYFFTKNDGLQNQAVLYVQPGLKREPRVLLDPNTLSKDGTVAIAAMAVSPDGRWLAYGTAAAGSDWNSVCIREVVTGKDTGDVLHWVKFSGLSWTRDNRGFFYSRYPEPGGVNGSDKTFAGLEHQKIYYHRLGTPQSADKIVCEIPEEPRHFLGGSVTEDGLYLIIAIRRGSAGENQLRVIDLCEPTSPRIDNPATELIDTWDAEYRVIGNDGPVLFVQTTLGAPRRRIMAVDLQAPQRENWRTVVPETEDVIESSGIVGGRVIVLMMRNVTSRLFVYSKSGALEREIPLPGPGTVAGFTGREDDPELFYGFTSLTMPATVFRYDLAGGRGEAFRRPVVPFDPTAFETKQIFYLSKDGTRVPMFVTHKKGLKIDGSAPTILYGYGGFKVSLTAGFSPANIAWLELGGVYAQPSLRGGGEYGEDWHEAGTKVRKQNVFDDFIAAAEWLFDNRYTSPSHLVISGGSNGGLLVGAVLAQRPDLCRVALPAVGVMDMLRFQKFTVGHAWVPEYGSSDDSEGFKVIRAYSPLHNLRPDTNYPAVLVTTGDHDDRVHPAHSFKYAASIQDIVAGRDAGPALIRIETQAGHGSGKPTSKIIDEAADKLAFAAFFTSGRQDVP